MNSHETSSTSPEMPLQSLLALYPGWRVANDPRSGAYDVVTIYRGDLITGEFYERFKGAWAVKRWMLGVVAWGEPFWDQATLGFYDLEKARAWVWQTFPYNTTYVPRATADEPAVLESWVPHVAPPAVTIH